MKKKKMRIRKMRVLGVGIIVILLIVSAAFYLVALKKSKGMTNQNSSQPEVLTYDKYFHDNVKTLKSKKIYQKEADNFKEVGELQEGLALPLTFDEEGEKGYFQIKDTTYYVDYKDIEAATEETLKQATYQNYVPFNESFKTESVTNFYQDTKLIATLNQGLELPIIIKDTDYLGVLYQDKLYYVKKTDGEIVEASNTSLKHTDAIATLVYHFVYDVNDQDEMTRCKNSNETICLSSTLFRQHMDYFKENNFYTATMEDLSLFIDGKVQLPEHTVVITIDDGYFTKASTAILEELGLHATLFLIGTAGKVEDYASPSLEIHSHTYELHYTGACPGGQGSPMKCLEKEKILADLKKSRDSLNGSTVFCYPFFEYNDYAINLLKEAGFEMAFIGGRQKIRVGSNKFILPRYGIISTTYVSDIAKIVN